MPYQVMEYTSDGQKQINSNRSELAQEIISEKLGFMEQWALVIFLGILLLILLAAWIIKYPDIIQTNATLTAANAPKDVIPRQDGRLVKLFVHNNEDVRQNEVFAWIESTASHAEVLELSKQVDSSITLLNKGQAEKVAQFFNKNYSNLGEIQPSYQTFVTALQNFNDFVVTGFYVKKKNMLLNDIQSLKSTNQTIENQKQLTQQDLKLAEETYNMNKKLYDEKVLAKEELRQENSKYINKQMLIPQLNASIYSNQMQERDKQKELIQLNHDIEQQPQIFQQALQSLKSQIDDWKKKYVLQSPIDGKISFVIPLKENQYIQPNKLIGYIIPNDTHFYIEAYLPQNNFGKVDTGQHVQLRFDAYPYQEVGFVEGTVNYVSNIASDSGFLTTIRLNKGLITNTNKSIPYKNGLKAQAIIVTKDMRLLSRLWYNINRSVSVGKK